MTQITATLVKELRDRSGAGMMDCKSALAENNGDIDQSIDWLRTKGITKAAKKSERVAAEGLVGSFVDNDKATIIELNSETDFVARNEEFQSLLKGLLKISINDVNILKLPFHDTGRTVEEEINEKIATIGENIKLRRIQNISEKNGLIFSYTHNSVSDSLGKIGVLLAIETSLSMGSVSELGKSICMHIAASNPIAISSDQISKEVIEKERQIAIEQAREAKKPENIIEKMVEGRIRKFSEENALLSQIFVIDNETKISKLLENKSNEMNSPIVVTKFIRMELGEGIEKKDEDFASEVAAAINKK